METIGFKKILRTALIAAIFMASGGCQQHPPANYDFQGASDQVVTGFAAAVSASYVPPANAMSNEAYSAGVVASNTLIPMAGNNPLDIGPYAATASSGFNYYGSSPYGGEIIDESEENEVQDCTSYVQGVPPISENYLYMVGALARCLDRILSYRNPLTTFAYRNMSSQSQQQWAYLLNWRVPGTYSSFDPTQFNYMNQYATQGYVPQSY